MLVLVGPVGVLGMAVVVRGAVRMQLGMGVIARVHMLVGVNVVVGMHVRVRMRMHDIAVPVLVSVGMGVSMAVPMLMRMAMGRIVAMAVLGVRHGPLLRSGRSPRL